jgi:hypothetical protein
MYGLTQDFIRNGGNYMILNRSEGLTYSDLNRVQTSMIMATKIPHQLPLQLKEINFKVSLQYDITDRKMLTHVLKSEKLTMEEFYILLLQLVDALEVSPSFMLDPEHYILREDYIFVEGPLHIGNLYLTYCPIQSLKNFESIQCSLSQLITRLMTSVSELQGNGIQTLLQYMNVEEFTLSRMKGILLNLLAKAGEYSQPHHIHNRMQQCNSHQSDPVSQPIPKRTEGVPFEREVRLPANSFDMDNYHENDRPEEDEGRESAPMATYVALGCLVACALVWRFLYMAHPGTGMLILSILITALLGVIVWMGWRGKLWMPMKGADPLTESEEFFETGDMEDSRLTRKKTSFQIDHLTGFLGGSSKDKEVDSPRGGWVFPESKATEREHTDGLNSKGDIVSSRPEEGEAEYYALLGHRTEILSSPRVNATVLLKPENSTLQGSNERMTSSNPYLERRETGQEEMDGLVHGDSAQRDILPIRIELNYPHFIIGREADVAQFVEEMPGTSRAHVELSKGSEGYVIKDLGSKNGTLLNKKLMVAYKEYPLHDGDIFTIVKGEYTFHLRS